MIAANAAGALESNQIPQPATHQAVTRHPK
jgi:hypothetical protein